MGVKNWDFTPWRWVSLDDIGYPVIAVDAPNYITRRLQAFEYGSKLSLDRISTSHLSLTLGIIRSCLSKKLLPVFIFDGPPETLKRGTNPDLVRRSSELYELFSKSTNVYDSKIAEPLARSKAMRWYFSVNHLKDLCTSLGIPSLTAPSEAEMLAAVMCREGMAGTVLSNDVDALLFGSPHVTRTIQFGKHLIERCRLDDIQQSVDLDLSHLRDLAILCGCDFHKQGVKGIGPRKGSVLLKRHGNLEKLLKAKGFSPSEIEEYVLAREVFEEPNFISASGLQIKLNPPNKHNFLGLLEPVVGRENAERQSRQMVHLWKNFNKEQTTLEQWV
ncbi:MAG: hypothetical protein P1Q69_02235 [Candidatus Thorarchaeota archaeon]|nr:hypothetical protein [Candidatus Thorarchaeota archaeon]